MALQVNATLENNEGLDVVNPVVFLDIILKNQPFVYLFWYKNIDAISQMKQAINIPDVPSFIHLNNLTNEDFFAPDLITRIHEIAKIKLEEVLGPGTVTIIGT